MTSFDKEGILDKYFYSYNNSGLISGIGRERRDLDAISGQYDYQYDEIGRLIRSSLNGQLRASYEYDAFGNRTSLTENDAKTTYTYDVLDRLIEARELGRDQISSDVLSLNQSQALVKTYKYDKRGNQTSEYVDGLLNKTFTFDATNMLSKVIDSEKGELENQYNGLGFRVASTRPEEKIEYLCDLSRDCFNLLERTVNGETESFIYDKNVISMSKAGNSYYYLQDELGSPMYMTGTDGVAVSSYAFDDFGRGIDPFTGRIKDYKNQYSNGIEHLGNKHAYTKEGNIIQPFAFTGYQEDEVSGLMFAQARHYNSENGRFVGEDQIRGFINAPNTQNHYTYCWDNPISLVDRNGLYPNTVDSQTNYENNIDFDANDSDVVVQNNNSNNCEESESVIDTVGKAISKAASYVSNIVDATILKSDWTDYQSVKQLAKNATEQTRMHNPGHSVDLYKSNNFIRNELKAEESLLKSTSSGAKSTAAAMEKVSNKLNALAIAIDVGIGVVDNVENGTYDRIIPDATVDMVATAGVIGCGSLASTIAATGTALALGFSATAATPVLIGAAAGVLAVYGVSKIVDEYKLPDGKTIRQEAKDLYYEGAKKIGGWLDKAFGWA